MDWSNCFPSLRWSHVATTATGTQLDTAGEGSCVTFCIKINQSLNQFIKTKKRESRLRRSTLQMEHKNYKRKHDKISVDENNF